MMCEYQTKNKAPEISASHGSEYEDENLLGCSVVSFVVFIMLFQ
jgi:hypothetical protein